MEKARGRRVFVRGAMAVAAAMTVAASGGPANGESVLAEEEIGPAGPAMTLQGPAGLPAPPPARMVRREDNPVPARGLAGRRVATEASHGLTWYNAAWRWQREDWFPGLHVYSSQEDYNSARMVNRWLLPYLENAGATVFNDRCRDEQTSEILIDPAGIGAPHEATGPWQMVSDATARGGTYLSVATTAATSPTATFTLRADIARSGFYGVTIWYPATANAAGDAQFVVIDAAGNRHPFRVDQAVRTAQWVWLDRFWFDAGSNVAVAEVCNAGATAGQTLALDTVRLGGGMGSEDFGGGVSGVPRWQECAVNWTKYAGAPEWVWNAGLSSGQDYLTRFDYAGWTSSDLLARVHSNGSVYHTGYGIEGYLYTRDADERSRMALLYPRMVRCIQTWYTPVLRDRGIKANGSSAWSFPYLLVEVAFHDYLTDAQALMDAKFRRVAMRGYYEGIVDFLTSGTGVYSPEPPEAIAVRNIGGGLARVTWRPAGMGGPPAGYRVYTSAHPKCFRAFAAVAATANTVDVPLLPAGQVTHIQMRALNEGGISFPSETLAAAAPVGAGAVPVLVVNGFDRFDWDIDETDNRRDFCAPHARAITGAAAGLGLSVAVDACSNEAITTGIIPLTDYRFVDWILGQESTADHCFTTDEQGAVFTFRQIGGTSLLVSGTDFAFDLGNSSVQTERDFLDFVLQTGYSSKAAAGSFWSVTGAAGTPFEGMALTLDDGTGDAYRVLAPDAVTAVRGSVACFNYSASGSPAGSCSPSPGHSLFCLAFPFEAIRGEATRQSVMAKILATVPAAASVGDWQALE